MKVKKYFFSTSLKPYFKFQQKGNIWRLLFNTNDIIIAETRDLRTKQAYLFSLDFSRREVYLKNFQLEEKWWFAIEGLNDKYSFIGNFERPEMPEHKGFKTINIKTGDLIWENNDSIYFFSSNEYVYVFKYLFESKIAYKLSVETGEIIDEIKNEEDIKKILEMKNEYDIHLFKEFVNTNMFNIYENTSSIKINEVEDKLKKVNPVGDIEYIEYNNLLIYNYHFNNGLNLKNLNENTLCNKLEVYDIRNNSIVFEDILNTSTSSYVPDSFFLKRNYLIYVREKRELVVINLDINI